LEQINTNNVQKLAPAWVFPVANAPRLEVTPVVVDGVMLTGPNEAYALDAVAGRQIWTFRTPRTPGLLSEAGGGANRGVAISGERVFMITDDAHLLALDRRTGRKLWDVTMADIKDGYSASAAPLVVGDLVLSSVAGGEEGARGFVDAYRVATGARVALLFDSRAWREGLGVLDRQCPRPRLRRHLVDRFLRCNAGNCVLGYRQSMPGL
jgi:alcohol dehydrogenase (cytochrome c)